MGNLDSLFKDVSGLQNTKTITKSQFEKYQNDLNSSSSLLGGNRSKPIDRSFFDSEYGNFKKTMENQ